ncbi:MAG: pantetheine-phosphate adenylyltransferase [Propionibacteriaceae bacterium]
MRRAVCPGSFDPVTRGHLDVVARATRLFDEVVVAVGVNPSKGAARAALFAPEERVDMLTEATAELGNVTVTTFSGLLVDFCSDHDVQAIVKGLRNARDLDAELQMAQMNGQLRGVDTVFLPTAPQWSYVSSSLVREVALLGGDVTPFLPPGVQERTVARVRERAAGRTAG